MIMFSSKAAKPLPLLPLWAGAAQISGYPLILSIYKLNGSIIFREAANAFYLHSCRTSIEDSPVDERTLSPRVNFLSFIQPKGSGLIGGIAGGLAGALAFCPAPASAQEDVKLPSLEVTGNGTASSDVPALQTSLGNSRLSGTVQDTPQAIVVVPKSVMEEQNTSSLQQALQNVPGITISVGEGEGGANGDQFLIRGFPAGNDIYLDGLRDFGVYTRDSFNYEGVQVLRGPSSEAFGSGTAGGAINIQTRSPTLEEKYTTELTAGLGPSFRGVVHLNHQIGQHSAVHLDVMGADQSLVGRDLIHSGRWGVAPSIAFGIGTKTTFTLSYMHQQDNRVPDYGVWVVQPPGGGTARPVTEFGVPRQNFYGTTTDHDDTVVDMVTGRLEHHAAPWLTLNNDTRFTVSSRDYAATQPRCDTSCTNALFSQNPSAATVIRTGLLGGPNPYTQHTWAIQNIATARANFSAAGFMNQLLAGVDVWHVHDRRYYSSYVPGRTRTSLFDPSHSPDGTVIVGGDQAPDLVPLNPNLQQRFTHKQAEGSDVGLFLSERFWLTQHLSVIAGVRWDYSEAHYDLSSPIVPTARLHASSSSVNPRFNLIYEPTGQQTYYFSYATATTPQGLYVANSSNPLTTQDGSKLPPEKTTIYEVGAKVGLLDGRLGAYGSLFRLEKANAVQTDPVSGDTFSTGDAQRNQGLELGISGNPTPPWSINLNYSLYDSQTVSSSTAADLGRRVPFVPKHSVTLWTSYQIAPGTAYNAAIGGGAFYRSGVFLDLANTASVPSNLSFDAFISHRIGNRWKIAVNGYNLTNRLNYGALFQNRAVPAPGRTVLFSLNATY